MEKTIPHSEWGWNRRRFRIGERIFITSDFILIQHTSSTVADQLVRYE